MTKIRFARATLAVLSLAAIAATPATRPAPRATPTSRPTPATRPAPATRRAAATRPAALVSPAAAAGERVVSKSRGVAFVAPAPWRRAIMTMPGELADQIFYFDLDAGARRGVAGRAGAQPPELSVGVTEPCERQEQLDQTVGDSRKALLAAPGVTLLEDRAIDVAGKPAWLLVTEFPMAGKRLKVDKDGARAIEEGPSFTYRQRRLLFIFNRTICDVRVRTEPSVFDRFAPHVDQLAASLALAGGDAPQ